MCLAGEDELHGITLIVDNLAQPLQVVEQQISTLIGGKAAGKTDEQGIGIDFVHDAGDARGIALVLEPTLLEIALDETDELLLQGHAHLPDFLVRDIHQGGPSGLQFLMVEEVVGQHLAVEHLPFTGCPGGHVHAIGNVAHMRLLGGITLPQAGEHLLAHLTMEPTNAIALLGGVQSEGAHAETLVATGVLTSHVHEFLP